MRKETMSTQMQVHPRSPNLLVAGFQPPANSEVGSTNIYETSPTLLDIGQLTKSGLIVENPDGTHNPGVGQVLVGR